ncbi:MAG: hypothetical protein HLUCCA12_07630 [Rhodobacteraceae bacterium HLUCCA12]|nr:MAG: hypothetical protein HLUCCA12_07630 [Rhodobacteraceae bacterium HLUCCA12]
MSDETDLKRLRMRAWRRGTKEMDLILGPFADTALAGLDPALRARFDALLSKNDHDLYQWLTARIGSNAAGGSRGPDVYAPLLDQIARHATARLSPGAASV